MGLIKGRIAPADIVPDDREFHLFETFGRMEREGAARVIVCLCRDKGGWVPFTKAELDARCRGRHFAWEGLDDPTLVLPGPDDTFEVTDLFVWKCARALCWVDVSTLPELTGPEKQHVYYPEHRL